MNVSKILFCWKFLIYVCMTYLLLYIIIFHDHEFLPFTNISEYHYFNKLLNEIERTTYSWRRYQMKTFSALLFRCEENPVTGGFPSQRPVTRSFVVFFHLRLNKRLSKQSIRLWFETPWRSLLRHCNVFSTSIQIIWNPSGPNHCKHHRPGFNWVLWCFTAFGELQKWVSVKL